MNGKIIKFYTQHDAAIALPIFKQAQGADPTQIDDLDLSIFGTGRLEYKVELDNYVKVQQITHISSILRCVSVRCVLFCCSIPCPFAHFYFVVVRRSLATSCADSFTTLRSWASRAALAGGTG